MSIHYNDIDCIMNPQFCNLLLFSLGFVRILSPVAMADKMLIYNLAYRLALTPRILRLPPHETFSWPIFLEPYGSTPPPLSNEVCSYLERQYHASHHQPREHETPLACSDPLYNTVLISQIKKWQTGNPLPVPPRSPVQCIQD
jgi:hypothetical protein